MGKIFRKNVAAFPQGISFSYSENSILFLSKFYKSHNEHDYVQSKYAYVHSKYEWVDIRHEQVQNKRKGRASPIDCDLGG